MTRRNQRSLVRRSQVNHLTADETRELLHGKPFFEGFSSDAALSSAWQAHRERIMADWIRKHPRTRPFAWWIEATARHGARRTTDEWTETHESHRSRWSHRGILHLDPPLLESEAKYLRRHGLLEPSEKRKAAR